MSRLELRLAAAAMAAIFAAASAPAALADPPPWAHDQGWRDEHHHHHHHHRHDEDDDDDRPVVVVAPPPPPPMAVPMPAPAVVMPYGLAQNTCHRDLIGAALGGAAGGLLGSNIGKSSGRTVATIGGVIVGAFVGGAIGRSMDEADQACVGQVLAHVPDHRTVVWQGPEHQGYWVTPVRSYHAHGLYCRDYESRAVIGGHVERTVGRACRGGDGRWRIVR